MLLVAVCVSSLRSAYITLCSRCILRVAAFKRDGDLSGCGVHSTRGAAAAGRAVALAAAGRAVGQFVRAVALAVAGAAGQRLEQLKRLKRFEIQLFLVPIFVRNRVKIGRIGQNSIKNDKNTGSLMK